jgi:hypothetical protein
MLCTEGLQESGLTKILVIPKLAGRAKHGHFHHWKDYVMYPMSHPLAPSSLCFYRVFALHATSSGQRHVLNTLRSSNPQKWK